MEVLSLFAAEVRPGFSHKKHGGGEAQRLSREK